MKAARKPTKQVKRVPIHIKPGDRVVFDGKCNAIIEVPHRVAVKREART